MTARIHVKYTAVQAVKLVIDAAFFFNLLCGSKAN